MASECWDRRHNHSRGCAQVIRCVEGRYLARSKATVRHRWDDRDHIEVADVYRETKAGWLIKTAHFVSRFLRIFGTILLLGGLAHSVGVGHLYFTAGIPEANRVLLDIWIAEAQLLGGLLYLVAGRNSDDRNLSRRLAVFGALIMTGFAIPMLPVLFSRAPIIFSVPAIIYLLLSVLVLVAAKRNQSADLPIG